MERVPLGKSITNEKFVRVVLRRRKRFLIWLVLVFLTMNSAIVNGILATAGGKIKADLRIMNLEYSTFLSIYGIGRIVGAIFLTSVINVANRKYLLVFAAFLKGASIFLFTVSTNYYFLMISRLFTGVGNAIVSGYAGTWIQQFGLPDWKTYMTSLHTFATPVGRSWGIQFEMNFGGPASWKMGMRLNSICLAACGILLCLFPSIYFSSKLVLGKGKDEKCESVLRGTEVSNASVFNARQSELEERDLGFASKIKVLCSNGIYFFLLMCRISIALINASFIFGMYGFVTSNFPESPKIPRTWIYCIIIVTGPFIGSMIGGFTTKMVGGYEKKYAFLIVLIADILVGCAILPMTFLTDWKIFMVNFYFYLIFASMVLPNLNGILNTTLPPSARAKGLALAALMTSCFGGFLAPIVFGTVSANHAETDKKYVMRFMAGCAFSGAFCMIIATIIRFYYGDPEDSKEEPIPVQGPSADLIINDEVKNTIAQASINGQEPAGEDKEMENMDENDIEGNTKL